MCKRCIAFVLAFLMACTVLAVPGAYAADAAVKLAITPDRKYAQAGDTVVFTLTLVSANDIKCKGKV